VTRTFRERGVERFGGQLQRQRVSASLLSEEIRVGELGDRIVRAGGGEFPKQRDRASTVAGFEPSENRARDQRRRGGIGRTGVLKTIGRGIRMAAAFL
jgi:hypothetical protein